MTVITIDNVREKYRVFFVTPGILSIDFSREVGQLKGSYTFLVFTQFSFDDKHAKKFILLITFTTQII